MKKIIIDIFLILILLTTIVIGVSTIETSGKSPSKTAVLFFDDGWKSQLSVVPVLQQYNFGATFGITTSRTNVDSNFFTSTDIKYLFNNGYEIASHSVNHIDAYPEVDQQFINELTKSKNTLEQIINQPIQTYIFPYGYSDTQTNNLALEYYSFTRSMKVDNGWIYFVGNEDINTFSENVLYTYEVNNVVAITYHQIVNSNMLSLFKSEMQWLYLNNYNVVSYAQYRTSTLSPTPLPTPSPTPTAIPQSFATVNILPLNIVMQIPIQSIPYVVPIQITLQGITYTFDSWSDNYIGQTRTLVVNNEYTLVYK
jgi:peptidoglycan/xylan/chitin deacetylase (PgdA/CDA1 family)